MGPAPHLCGPPRQVPSPGQLVPAEAPRPQVCHGESPELGMPLAWDLGTQPWGVGSRRLQAAGPGLMDSHPRLGARGAGGGAWLQQDRRAAGALARSPPSLTPGPAGRLLRLERGWARVSYLTPPVSSVPAAPGTGAERTERSEHGPAWEGAGEGVWATLPVPKCTGKGLKLPCNKIWKDRCSVGFGPCPFRRRTSCEAALSGRRVGTPQLQCIFSAYDAHPVVENYTTFLVNFLIKISNSLFQSIMNSVIFHCSQAFSEFCHKLCYLLFLRSGKLLKLKFC